ncbi:hypothetical protein FRB99_001492 [Tulasnella sp. 403]|nr:hypothetical protein FRB99_001492 [Tulasnella sp. 403]
MPLLPILPSTSSDVFSRDTTFLDYLAAQEARFVHKQLVGLICAIVTYVIYLVIFLVTVFTQRRRQLESPSIWAVLVSTFILASAQLSMQLAEGQPVLAGEREAYVIYESHRNPFLPTKNVLLLFINLITHLVIIWRLMHVWAYDRRIIYGPVVFTAVGTIVGLVAAGHQIQMITSSDETLHHPINRLSMIAFGVTFTCNLLTTILISHRLCREFRNYTGDNPPTIPGLLRDVSIESGLIYTLTLFALPLIYSLGGSHGFFIIFGHFVPFVIATAPTLIIMNLRPGRPRAGTPDVLIKPPLPQKRMDGLSLRCAGLEPVEEDWSDIVVSSAIAGSPMTRPAGRKGWI